MFDISKLAEKIKFHRARLGLTQSALGEKLNVSFQAVSCWETGASLPDLDNLCRLAQLFQVSVDQLLQSTVPKDAATYIAIDGGGTKTEAVLFSRQGVVLKTIKLGGCNASHIGFDQAVAIHTSVIDAFLECSKNVTGVFIGCAGSMLEQIQKALSEKYRHLQIFVEPNGLNVLSSAPAEVALICNTGTVLLRREAQGYVRTGGWGYILGDPCSAYNFGRAAVRAAMAYEDRLESSPLIYRLLLEKMGFSVLRGNFRFTSVADMAALASVVFAAYRLGDATAAAIIRAEATELAQMIFSAAKKGDRVVACGSIVAQYGDILFPVLESILNGYVQILIPPLPPVYGAAVECARRMLLSIPDGFQQTFSETYLSFSAEGSEDRPFSRPF